MRNSHDRSPRMFQLNKQKAPQQQRQESRQIATAK